VLIKEAAAAPIATSSSIPASMVVVLNCFQELKQRVPTP
jgi:hypothetical protein